MDEKRERRVVKLRQHLLETELPSILSTINEQLDGVRESLDHERNQAVLVEVARRGAARQRLQRLSKLEAERKMLEKELAVARAECATINKRVENSLAESQRRRNGVFERFTKWDLHRRTLSHLIHHQEITERALERLSTDMTLGMVAPSPRIANIPATTSAAAAGATDDATRSLPLVNDSFNLSDASHALLFGAPSGKRHDRIIVGSVEFVVGESRNEPSSRWCCGG